MDCKLAIEAAVRYLATATAWLPAEVDAPDAAVDLDEVADALADAAAAVALARVAVQAARRRPRTSTAQ